MMKTCSKCGDKLDLSNFYKDGERTRAECKKCVIKRANAYDKLHRDEINARRRAPNSAHKKNRILYTKKNNEKIKAQSRKWGQTPSGVFCAIHGRAGQHNIPFEIPRDEFIEWYVNVKKVCAYCGIDAESNKSYRGHNSRRLTIDRKDSNRGYRMDNIVLACAICNTTKSNVLTYEQMKIVGKMIKMNRKQNIILPSYRNGKEAFASSLGGMYDACEVGLDAEVGE